jgi:hypothetical protein
MLVRELNLEGGRSMYCEMALLRLMRAARSPGEREMVDELSSAQLHAASWLASSVGSDRLRSGLVTLFYWFVAPRPSTTVSVPPERSGETTGCGDVHTPQGSRAGTLLPRHPRTTPRTQPKKVQKGCKRVFAREGGREGGREGATGTAAFKTFKKTLGIACCLT